MAITNVIVAGFLGIGIAEVIFYYLSGVHHYRRRAGSIPHRKRRARRSLLQGRRPSQNII